MLGKLLTAPFKVIQSAVVVLKIPLEVMCGEDNVIKETEREIDDIWN